MSNMARNNPVSDTPKPATRPKEAPAGSKSIPGHRVSMISSSIRFAPLSGFPQKLISASSSTEPRPVECCETPKWLDRFRSGSASTNNAEIPAREASPASIICHSVFAVPPLPESTSAETATTVSLYAMPDAPRCIPPSCSRCCQTPRVLSVYAEQRIALRHPARRKRFRHPKGPLVSMWALPGDRCRIYPNANATNRSAMSRWVAASGCRLSGSGCAASSRGPYRSRPST